MNVERVVVTLTKAWYNEDNEMKIREMKTLIIIYMTVLTPRL